MYENGIPYRRFKIKTINTRSFDFGVQICSFDLIWVKIHVGHCAIRQTNEIARKELFDSNPKKFAFVYVYCMLRFVYLGRLYIWNSPTVAIARSVGQTQKTDPNGRPVNYSRVSHQHCSCPACDKCQLVSRTWSSIISGTDDRTFESTCLL